MCLLTPLNVNCHASDGRKSTPLHLAAGYNRFVALPPGPGESIHPPTARLLQMAPISILRLLVA